MKARLVLLLVLSAATALSAEDDLARLVAELGGSDVSKRSTALTALRNRKDPRALGLVEKSLAGFGDMGRYYAVMYIDSCPQNETKPVWRRLLSAEDPWLKISAATGLYRMGERNMVEPIVKSLLAAGPDEAKRVRMIYRLYSIKEPRVLEALRRFISPGGRVTPMGAALSVLASQKDRASIPAVASLSKDDRPGVRAMGAAWLFRMGDRAAAKDLAAALRTGKVETNEFSRVYSLLMSAPALPDPVLEALAALLDEDSGNSTALMYSIRLLAKAGYRKALGPIRRLLNHSSSTVAKAAFDALMDLEGGLDEAALLPLLNSDDVEKKLMGADALRRLNNRRGLSIVIDILANGESNDRSEAARVLGGFRVPAAVEPLIKALSDGNSLVRMRAGYSLSAVLGSLFPYRRFNFNAVGWSYSASPAANRPAIAAIRAFWDAHKDADW